MTRVALIGSTHNETNSDIVREWRLLGLRAELLSGREALRVRLGRWF